MLMIGWTTVARREDAERLAGEMVRQRLAACVQIDGPLQSVYQWEGKLESSEEYRLTVKFIPENERAVKIWLEAHHPYETPEWCVIKAERVAEKYLSWARANSTSAPS